MPLCTERVFNGVVLELGSWFGCGAPGRGKSGAGRGVTARCILFGSVGVNSDHARAPKSNFNVQNRLHLPPVLKNFELCASSPPSLRFITTERWRFHWSKRLTLSWSGM